MDTVASTWSGRGPRGSQDETSPFPLEFMVARPLGQSQDETSPFPLDFVVVARKRRGSQDETAPFPLEYEVTRLDADDGAVRIQRRERPRAEPQPRRTLSELDASAPLREYAARLAAGEALPPYRGPILASEERAQPVAGRERAESEPARFEPTGFERAGFDAAVPSSNAGKAIVKLALGVMLMMAALVAAAVGGDDAALRSAGAAIGGWFTGNDGSFESFPLNAASGPCNERLERASSQKR